MPYASGFFSALDVDHTKVGAADSTDFPVLFAGGARFATVANGGRAANASGYDVRPYADNGAVTARDFELVPGTYNATTGAMEMYVRYPTISHTSDSRVYMFAGDASFTTDGSSTSTWDSHFQGVWHLGDGSTLSLADSTSHARTLTNIGSATATVGLNGGAASLNGSSQGLKYTSAAPVATEPVTFSIMFKPTGTSGDLIGEFDATGAAGGIGFLGLRPSGVLRANPNSAGAVADTAASAYSTGAWNYGAATFVSSASRTIRCNTATAVTNTTSQAQGTPNSIAIGARVNSGTTNNFANTLVDEARVSDVDRGADWFTAEYNNLTSPSTFTTLGTETPVSSSITGSSSLAVPLAGSATATVLAQGSSSQAVPLAGSAAGAVLVQGSSSESVPLAGSAVGQVLVQGASSQAVPIAGAATAAVLVQGATSQPMPLSGAATGQVLVQAISASPVPLGGSAAAVVLVQAASTQSMPLAGAAAGIVLVQAQSSQSMPLSGLAVGLVLIQATSIGAIVLRGTAAGTVVDAGVRSFVLAGRFASIGARAVHSAIAARVLLTTLTPGATASRVSARADISLTEVDS